MTDNYSYIQELICNVSNKNRPFFADENYKGGFDRYQSFLTCVLVFGAVILPTSLVYGMTFLFLEPQLLCQGPSGNWYSCDRDTACASENYMIDYNDPDTIKNLVTYMDLLCEDNYHQLLAIIGAITLFGCLIGSLLLMPFADHYGRRTMNIIFLSCQTFAMWMFLGAMVFRGSYWMLCVSCFIGGSVAIPLIGVMICYSSELSAMEMMTFCTGASFLAEALTSILIGVYFKHLKDSAVFYLIISCLLTVFLIFYSLMARETPHFLFKMRRYQECLEHLALMGEWNGYTGYPHLPSIQQMKIARDRSYTEVEGKNSDNASDQLIKRETEQSQENKKLEKDATQNAEHQSYDVTTSQPVEESSFKALRANSKVWRNTMILCGTWTVSSYSFYFVEFYLRFIPTNTIYMQKMLMGCADIVATVIYYLMVTKIGMVRSFTILFGLLAISSICLVITLAVTDAEELFIIEPSLSASLSIMIIGMRIAAFSTFAINYSQVVQLTPTLMTGLVFGVVNTVARGFTIFAPLVAELVENSAWTCTLMSVVGIVIVPYFNLNTKIE